MRKTIASLELEIVALKALNDSLQLDLQEACKDRDVWKGAALRSREVSDRLLNIMEWNAKEGRGYASGH